METRLARSEASVQTDQLEVNLMKGAEYASAETLDVTADLNCNPLTSTTTSCVDGVDAGELQVTTSGLICPSDMDATDNAGPRSPEPEPAGMEGNAIIQHSDWSHQQTLSRGDCASEHLISALRMTNLLQLIQLDLQYLHGLNRKLLEGVPRNSRDALDLAGKLPLA
eukprot:334439-Hanusia_phi.AAC.1